MSKEFRLRKFMRKEVRRNTAKLGKQMMENTLKMPLRKRLQVALIVIFKRPM